MRWLASFRNKKYRLAFTLAIVVLVIPNFVFAGYLDFGVMILSLFARLTGWAGIILNLAIMELVFNMGTVLNDSIGDSVENAWAVIRDVMNLLFIFSLIYIGFQTILDFGSPRRLLPPLIIAALLINFSLFFTKFIVDISNVAAVEIYTSVGFVPPNPTQDPKLAEEALVNVGVSGAYMQKMGLKDLISPQNDQANNAGQSYIEHLEADCTDSASQSDCNVMLLVYFLASIIFFLIAAYAFAVGAFMLLWRFIILIVLMIFSPFMFIGMIFPKAQKWQSRWWNTFLSAAFFAPAYLLMLYIGYAVSSKINVFSTTFSDGTPKGMFDAVAGNYAAVDLILNFAIVCGFLLMAVSVAKEMGSHGAGATIGLVDNIKRRGQRALYRTGGLAAGAAMGAGAYGLRTTAGRNAYETANANNKTGERLTLQAQGTGMKAWYARQRLAANAQLAKASFDPRQSMSKDAQKNFGTGVKGGFEQRISDRKKIEESRSKLYGQNDSQVYADYGVVEQRQIYNNIGSDIAKLRKEIASSEDVEERKNKTKLLSTKIGQQKAMGKGQLYDEFGKTWDKYNESGGTLTKTEFEAEKNKRLNALKLFVEAKNQESGYGARQYAENLKSRYTGSKASRLFGWLYDDPDERKAAAKEITKKNSSKTSGQKIEDIIKELQKAESGSSSAPVAEKTTS